MSHSRTIKILKKRVRRLISISKRLFGSAKLTASRSEQHTHADANRSHAVTQERSLHYFLQSGATLEFGDHANEKHCQHLVSLVVVLFNQAPLSLACLQRIACLSYKNIELLVVDNASTDFTPQLLDRLKGKVRLFRPGHNLHFLRACNLAFRELSPDSKYVVLVNNDALLSSQALDEALAVFERWPDTGIVGGQILHLDGQLQEAGNTLLRDGSCRGIGRRKSPWHPLVQVRRKVDFVSGCFLMISTPLLKSIGGFDERFSPAYYEETDLCVESWKRGRPVVYEPRCLIHHVEFASSEQGSLDAAKLMLENCKRFHAKHNAWLTQQPEPEQFADLGKIEHCLRLAAYPVRILWIDDRLPDSAQGAGFGRLQAIIEQLANLNIFVTLFTTDYPSEHEAREYRGHAHSCDYELQWGKEEDLAHLLEHRSTFYTHIVASRHHNFACLRYCLARVPHLSINKPVLVGDIESIFSIRKYCLDVLRNTNRIASMGDLQGVPDIAHELNEIKMFDRLMAVSEQEQTLLQANTSLPVAQVGHLFFPVDDVELPRFNNTNGLIFMGAMNFPGLPNLDSLHWLADSVLPALRKLGALDPEFAPLTIIGPYSKQLAQPSLDRIAEIWPLRHLGRVEDVSGELHTHRLFLAPTRFASGLPHKVQHAISQGLPVVTTELIASQMGCLDGQGILYSNDPIGFATCIADVYNDEALWSQLQKDGLDYVREECSLNQLRQGLSDTFLT